MLSPTLYDHMYPMHSAMHHCPRATELALTQERWRIHKSCAYESTSTNLLMHGLSTSFHCKFAKHTVV